MATVLDLGGTVKVLAEDIAAICGGGLSSNDTLDVVPNASKEEVTGIVVLKSGQHIPTTRHIGRLQGAWARAVASPVITCEGEFDING